MVFNCMPKHAASEKKQAAVDCIYHPAEAWLSAEFMTSGCAEVIVWPEGLIEGGNQIEEGLAAALVAQRTLIITTLALAQSAGTEA